MRVSAFIRAEGFNTQELAFARELQGEVVDWKAGVHTPRFALNLTHNFRKNMI
jgi:hypothetical protein